jgi:hypothetical protein
MRTLVKHGGRLVAIRFTQNPRFLPDTQRSAVRHGDSVMVENRGRIFEGEPGKDVGRDEAVWRGYFHTLCDRE